jgi:hypothetical protein
MMRTPATTLQPEASIQEVLAGLIERVTNHNDEDGFWMVQRLAVKSRSDSMMTGNGEGPGLRLNGASRRLKGVFKRPLAVPVVVNSPTKNVDAEE